MTVAVIPGSLSKTEAANARRLKNAGRAAKRSAERFKAAKAVAALPEMPDPKYELLANARAGDKHAQWRADMLFVNLRPGRRKAVAECA